MAKQSKEKAMQQAFPEIELYMWSLNQEYPDGLGLKKPANTRVEAFTNDHGQITEYRRIISTLPTVADDNPDGGWPEKVVWAIKFDDPPKDRGRPVEAFPLLEVQIREEDFGAIVFDARRDRVFRVNRLGLGLLQEIMAGQGKSKGLARFESGKGVDDKTLAFVSFLKGAGLWIR